MESLTNKSQVEIPSKKKKTPAMHWTADAKDYLLLTIHEIIREQPGSKTFWEKVAETLGPCVQVKHLQTFFCRLKHNRLKTGEIVPPGPYLDPDAVLDGFEIAGTKNRGKANFGKRPTPKRCAAKRPKRYKDSSDESSDENDLCDLSPQATYTPGSKVMKSKAPVKKAKRLSSSNGHIETSSTRSSPPLQSCVVKLKMNNKVEFLKKFEPGAEQRQVKTKIEHESQDLLGEKLPPISGLQKSPEVKQKYKEDQPGEAMRTDKVGKDLVRKTQEEVDSAVQSSVQQHGNIHSHSAYIDHGFPISMHVNQGFRPSTPINHESITAENLGNIFTQTGLKKSNQFHWGLPLPHLHNDEFLQPIYTNRLSTVRGNPDQNLNEADGVISGSAGLDVPPSSIVDNDIHSSDMDKLSLGDLFDFESYYA